MTWSGGPALVVAGAGSGKTRVLTERIVHLVETQKVAPESILAFTFTNAASDEMKRRLADRLGDTIASKLNLGTIHSQMFGLLQAEFPTWRPRAPKLRVMSEYGYRKLVIDKIDELGLTNMTVELGLAYADFVKSGGLEPDCPSDALVRLEALGFKPRQKSNAPKLYTAVEIVREKDGWITFGDMEMDALRMLRDRPDILRKLTTKLRHVLVDEAQDLSHVQFKLVTLLASAGTPFFVGDPRQAIYGFRGGTPTYLMEFTRFYPTGTALFLKTNYRCAPRVVSLGNAVMRGSAWGQAGRLPDAVAHKAQPHGTAIWLGLFQNDEAEATRIAELVKRCHEERGVRWRDIAVLYRTNLQAPIIEEAFLKLGIPYWAEFTFWDRTELKDLLAYLRVAQRQDLEAFRRIYNRPNRDLKPGWLRKFESGCDLEHGLVDRLGEVSMTAKPDDPGRGGIARAAREISALVRAHDEMTSVGELMAEIRRVTGYDHHLRLTYPGEASAVRIKTLDAVQNAAMGYTTVESYRAYVNAIVESSKQQALARNAVGLMTLHRAKGLEYKVVFLVGCNKGILPHERAEVEEERRLFYVGVTRSEEWLYLSGVRFMGGRLHDVSPFVAELGLCDPALPQEPRIHAGPLA